LLYDVFSAKLAMHIVVYTNKYEDENTKCHTVGTVPKYNRRIVEDTKWLLHNGNRRTENTMVKYKRTKDQAMIYETYINV
jgi:hypothetical protein